MKLVVDLLTLKEENQSALISYLTYLSNSNIMLWAANRVSLVDSDSTVCAGEQRSIIFSCFSITYILEMYSKGATKLSFFRAYTNYGISDKGIIKFITSFMYFIFSLPTGIYDNYSVVLTTIKQTSCTSVDVMYKIGKRITPAVYFFAIWMLETFSSLLLVIWLPPCWIEMMKLCYRWNIIRKSSVQIFQFTYDTTKLQPEQEAFKINPTVRLRNVFDIYYIFDNMACKT